MERRNETDRNIINPGNFELDVKYIGVKYPYCMMHTAQNTVETSPSSQLPPPPPNTTSTHIYFYYLHDVARMMGENNYSFMSPPSLHHSNTHRHKHIGTSLILEFFCREGESHLRPPLWNKNGPANIDKERTPLMSWVIVLYFLVHLVGAKSE